MSDCAGCSDAACGCQAGVRQTGKRMGPRKSCVICRDNGKTQFLKILTNGSEYKKCMPVVESASDPCKVVPMTDPKQTIFGVIMCYVNLTDAAEDEVCEQKILVCAEFDVTHMCWPSTFTLDDIKKIMSTHIKPCFSGRLEDCILLPEYLQSETENTKTKV